MVSNWRHGRGSGDRRAGRAVERAGSKPAPTTAGGVAGGGFSRPLSWVMLAGALAAGSVGAMPALAQGVMGASAPRGASAVGDSGALGGGGMVFRAPQDPQAEGRATGSVAQQGKGNAAQAKVARQAEGGKTRSPGDTRKQTYSPSATTGSPGHIFWVIPAFKVNYGNGFEPLTPKEKFQEWAQSSYDPLGLGVGAFEAGTLEYSHSDGFCGYGVGAANYGKCFGSLELDATDSSFIGDFVLPVLWHQDPRYFRLGEGGFGRRVWWAVSRVFVTYNDSGHTVFYSSALTGTVVAAALSNLYYPSQDVGAGHTMSRIGIDLGNTALYNLAAEFWPDIDHKVHRLF